MQEYVAGFIFDVAQVRWWRLTISRLWPFPNSSCPWRDPRWLDLRRAGDQEGTEKWWHGKKVGKHMEEQLDNIWCQTKSKLIQEKSQSFETSQMDADWNKARRTICGLAYQIVFSCCCWSGTTCCGLKHSQNKANYSTKWLGQVPQERLRRSQASQAFTVWQPLELCPSGSVLQQALHFQRAPFVLQQKCGS